MVYHRPVLLQECIDGLKLSDGGIYVDVTFGGGGHSKAILDQLNGGKLLAFDQDADSWGNAWSDDRLVLIKQNFKYLKNMLRMHQAIPVNGILADLGVSSHQFDAEARGFSIRFDGELDMRMDQSADRSAKEIVNEYPEEELKRLFWEYGELKNARVLAAEIIRARHRKAIEKVFELKSIVASYAPRRKENQFYARIFQALRIEVNDELGALKSLLEQSVQVLAEGGRLVVISYHSLEDRLVKNFIKTGNFAGKEEKDFYGNLMRPLKPVRNKVIVPDEAEIEENSRARSAKLRIAEKPHGEPRN